MEWQAKRVAELHVALHCKHEATRLSAGGPGRSAVQLDIAPVVLPDTREDATRRAEAARIPQRLQRGGIVIDVDDGRTVAAAATLELRFDHKLMLIVH